MHSLCAIELIITKAVTMNLWHRFIGCTPRKANAGTDWARVLRRRLAKTRLQPNVNAALVSTSCPIFGSLGNVENSALWPPYLGIGGAGQIVSVNIAGGKKE